MKIQVKNFDFHQIFDENNNNIPSRSKQVSVRNLYHYLKYLTTSFIFPSLDALAFFAILMLQIHNLRVKNKRYLLSD